MSSANFSVLTLLLVVGAVTCSPLPSEFPAFAAQDAAHHVEVTHEVRHVTFEVSEEVSDATASSQVPSAVPPEDDPPIPTATTPPTRPEVSLPQEVDQQPSPHNEQGLENQTPEKDHVAPAHQSDEPSHGTSTESSINHEDHLKDEREGKEVVGEEEEDPEEDTATERVSAENTSAERDPLDLAIGVVPEDTAAEESSADASTTQEHSSSKDEEGASVITEDVTTHENAPEQSPLHVETSSQSVAEDIELIESAGEDEHKMKNGAEEKNTESEVAVEENVTDAANQEENVTAGIMSEEVILPESKSAEPTSHDLQEMQADEPKETILLETPTGDTEKEEEGLDNKSEKETLSEQQPSVEDVTKSSMLMESAQADNNSQDSITGQSEGEENEDVNATPKGEKIPPPEQEAGQEKLNSDVLDPRVKKEVDITGEGKRSAEDSSENIGKFEEESGKAPEELHPVLVKAEAYTSSPVAVDEHNDRGNVAYINDAPSSLDSSEASPEDTPFMVEKQPNSESESAVTNAPVGTPRKSRIYNEDEYEDPVHATHPEDPDVPNSSVTEEDKPKLVNSGLESLSMTSPTPEVPPEDVPFKVTEEDQVPPNNGEDIVPVTPSLEIEETEESNITVIDKVEEPPTVHKEDDEVVVVDDIPQSSSAAPGDDYHDSYTDPLDIGDLPDIDVTREDLPSKEHPVTNVEEANPGEPTGNGDEVAGDSSDLAAGDHMLEVEAGTPRVLPPQQEQVSAAAPTSLTVGCIIAIVFGVLVSLVILVGVGGFVLYQRRTLNRPKALNSDRGYAGSDSGGYIDDQVRVSYVNSQIDTPKTESSKPSESEQAPQVFIMLKNLKPATPEGAANKLRNSLPSMPKIRPINLPNIGQFISKREPGGSNQPGQ